MKNNRIPRHFGRALALFLCICLVCLPLMGMAAQGESVTSGEADSGEPDTIMIDILPEAAEPPTTPEATEDVTPIATPETTPQPETSPEAPDNTEQPEPPSDTPQPDSTEETEPPAPVCICETKCSADAPKADCPVCTGSIENCIGKEPAPTPVCVCEVKCSADAPKTDCLVCAADVVKCEGKLPDPDFTIRILRPSGWYTDKAAVTIRVTDENKTSWKKVEVRIEKNGAWMDLTDKLEDADSTELIISENCTVYVTVTDKDGKTHAKNAYIECFDREAPTVRAGIDGALLRVEANDTLSGVEYIYVNGYRFANLTNGTLDVRLKDYADEYEQMSVMAVDYAGNKSKTVQVKNPYYGRDDKDDKDDDDKDSHDGRCPDDCDCRQTSTPAPTAKPTTGNTTNTNNGSGGGKPAAQTATPTPTPKASAEETEVTREPGAGFTDNGNAITRDLLYDKHTNKQFIAVETKDGNTFYVVIDYDKPIDEEADLYETYFLNLVDNADLMALLEDGAADAPEVCACPEKCVAGEVNTSCPICKNNMSECAGKEAVPEPEPQDTETPPEEEPKSSPAGAIAIVLLLLAVGGAAVWYFKFRKPKDGGKGKNDLDDYAFDDDEDEDAEYESEDAELSETEAADEETEREDE